jgi:glycosyltransferase involved in cell wall biosynthesis
MPQPFVSIIIDNYNYGQYVGAAIRSALDQTYPDVEVIVVDDGSTDQSASVIRGFGDRITAMFQANLGQSEAFRAGWNACRGEIVLFLDSDDALRPDAIETIVARWAPDVSKAQWCLASVDGEGKFLGNVFPNFPPNLTDDEIRREVLRTALYPCPPTSGNAYARWFLEQVMPFYQIRCGADGPLNTVAPLYGRTLTIDRPLGYYRVHGKNDGAQGVLAAEKFSRFIEMDRMRARYLRQHAARLEYDLEGDPLDRAVLHLQYRLASLRLVPEKHPVAGETLSGITWRGLCAAATTRDRWSARLFLSAWYLAVAFGPRILAERLVVWRFVPASRSKRLAKLLRRLGVLRRTGSASSDLSLPPALTGGLA